MMNFDEQLNAISSYKELSSYLRNLLESYVSGKSSWENNSLEKFLEAAANWIEDMEGYYKNSGETVPEQPEWRTIGLIFLAATNYE